MLSYEIYDIFKNTYFEEHLRTTVSRNQFHKLVVISLFPNSHCEFFYPNKERIGIVRTFHNHISFVNFPA